MVYKYKYIITHKSTNVKKQRNLISNTSLTNAHHQQREVNFLIRPSHFSTSYWPKLRKISGKLSFDQLCSYVKLSYVDVNGITTSQTVNFLISLRYVTLSRCERSLTSVKCTRLKTKYDAYSSYHISVNLEEYELLNKADYWPEGSLVLPYHGKLLPDQIYTSSEEEIIKE